MRGFREVGWVASVAGTALGCYMVSLKVASERTALEDVQNRIVLAQRDIRVLQTEIGTRGRLEQLESWNVKVLALSAPQAHQFLEGEFQLATLAAPRKTIDPGAPVVLAAAPAPQRPNVADDAGEAGGRRQDGPTARDLMQVASLKRDLPAAPTKKAVDKPSMAKPRPVKPAVKAATADATVVKAPDKSAARPKTPVAATSQSKDSKARQ